MQLVHAAVHLLVIVWIDLVGRAGTLRVEKQAAALCAAAHGIAIDNELIPQVRRAADRAVAQRPAQCSMRGGGRRNGRGRHGACHERRATARISPMLMRLWRRRREPGTAWVSVPSVADNSGFRTLIWLIKYSTLMVL